MGLFRRKRASPRFAISREESDALRTHMLSGAWEIGLAHAKEEDALQENMTSEERALIRDMDVQSGRIIRGCPDSNACRDVLERYEAALSSEMFRTWHELRLEHGKQYILDELKQAASG